MEQHNSSGTETSGGRVSYRDACELGRDVLRRAMHLVPPLSRAHWHTLMAVLNFTTLFSRVEDHVAVSEIAEFAGYSKRWTRVLLKNLDSFGLITYGPGSGAPPKKRGAADSQSRYSYIALKGGSDDAQSLPPSQDQKVEQELPSEFPLSSEGRGNDSANKGEGSGTSKVQASHAQKGGTTHAQKSPTEYLTEKSEESEKRNSRKTDFPEKLKARTQRRRSAGAERIDEEAERARQLRALDAWNPDPPTSSKEAEAIVRKKVVSE